MSIDPIANTVAATFASNGAKQAAQTTLDEKKPWTVEDVIDVVTEAEGKNYSVGRLALYSEVVKGIVTSNADIGVDDRRRGVTFETREATQDEIADFNGGFGGTIVVHDDQRRTRVEPSEHRDYTERFASERRAEFETYIRQGVAEGKSEGTDWHENFFLDNASQAEISRYNHLKSEANEAEILSDKRGRYLAQHGIDLATPLNLVRVDDGSYLEVSGHPQKHQIEHLINSAPELWGRTWDDVWAARGNLNSQRE